MSGQEFFAFQLCIVIIASFLFWAQILAIATLLALPIVELFAVPTYILMVLVEEKVSARKKGGCPTFLQFNQPKFIEKKAIMASTATLSTSSGVFLVVSASHWGGRIGSMPNIELVALFVQSSFPKALLFFAFLIGTYLVAYFYKDEERAPLNKLATIFPEWAKNLFLKRYL